MCELNVTEENIQLKIINKCTGSGGTNTNYYGEKFEEKTNNLKRLPEMGFAKNIFTKKNTKFDYLSKTSGDKTIVAVMQSGLKNYMKYKYNIDDVYRFPDEAYIFEDNGKKVLKILEKKAQRVEGSVEDKLLAGVGFKKCYEKMFGPAGFEVFYGFCVSDFLKKKLVSDKKRYIHLNELLNENNIEVLFGDDDNYFETLDKWINNSL